MRHSTAHFVPPARRTVVGLILRCCLIASAAITAVAARPALAGDSKTGSQTDTARPLRVNVVHDGSNGLLKEAIRQLRGAGIEVNESFRPDKLPQGPQTEAPSVWGGYSAGAHKSLIRSALQESAHQIDALVLFSAPLLPHDKTGYRSIGLSERLPPNDPDRYLRDVRIPTLVVHGSGDEIISPVYVERFARDPSNTGVQALFMVGAGHTIFGIDKWQLRYVNEVTERMIADLVHGRFKPLDPHHRVTIVTRAEGVDQYRPLLTEPKLFQGKIQRPVPEGHKPKFWHPGSLRPGEAPHPVRVVHWRRDSLL